MTARSNDSEPVGSLGEEAVRLLAALQDRAGGGHEHDASSGDCRFCPVCRMVGAVRSTPPEVREHLSSAGASLVQAVSALLATAVPDDAGRADENAGGADDDAGRTDEDAGRADEGRADDDERGTD